MYYLKTMEAAQLEMMRQLLGDLGPDVDLVDGSTLRSLVEAMGFQVGDVSERQERSILDAIPDAVFTAFGFAALPEKSAQGALVFSTPVPAGDVILIPRGSEGILTDEVTYATTQDAWIAPGQSSVEVPAVCTRPGVIGNAAPLTVTRLATGIPGVQGVTNPAAFTGGRDPETRAQQGVRFARWLSELDESNPTGLRGAVLGAQITVGDGDGAQVLTAHNALVRDADTDPTITPPYFQVHTYRRGGLPEDLRLAIKAAVHQARAGGTFPLFTWTAGTPVDVSVEVDAPDLTTQERALAEVRQAVADYFTALDYGQKVSAENLITACTNAHPGIREITLHLPGVDVLAGPVTRLELGALFVWATGESVNT